MTSLEYDYNTFAEKYLKEREREIRKYDERQSLLWKIEEEERQQRIRIKHMKDQSNLVLGLGDKI